MDSRLNKSSTRENGSNITNNVNLLKSQQTNENYDTRRSVNSNLYPQNSHYMTHNKNKLSKTSTTTIARKIVNKSFQEEIITTTNVTELICDSVLTRSNLNQSHNDGEMSNNSVFELANDEHNILCDNDTAKSKKNVKPRLPYGSDKTELKVKPVVKYPTLKKTRARKKTLGKAKIQDEKSNKENKHVGNVHQMSTEKGDSYDSVAISPKEPNEKCDKFNDHPKRRKLRMVGKSGAVKSTTNVEESVGDSAMMSNISISFDQESSDGRNENQQNIPLRQKQIISPSNNKKNRRIVCHNALRERRDIYKQRLQTEHFPMKSKRVVEEKENIESSFLCSQNDGTENANHANQSIWQQQWMKQKLHKTNRLNRSQEHIVVDVEQKKSKKTRKTIASSCQGVSVGDVVCDFNEHIDLEENSNNIDLEERNGDTSNLNSEFERQNNRIDGIVQIQNSISEISTETNYRQNGNEKIRIISEVIFEPKRLANWDETQTRNSTETISVSDNKSIDNNEKIGTSTQQLDLRDGSKNISQKGVTTVKSVYNDVKQRCSPIIPPLSESVDLVDKKTQKKIFSQEKKLNSQIPIKGYNLRSNKKISVLDELRGRHPRIKETNDNKLNKIIAPVNVTEVNEIVEEAVIHANADSPTRTVPSQKAPEAICRYTKIDKQYKPLEDLDKISVMSPTDLNIPSSTTMNYRSGRGKRLLYNPNVPIDQYIAEASFYKEFNVSKPQLNIADYSNSNNELNQVPTIEEVHENNEEAEILQNEQQKLSDEELVLNESVHKKKMISINNINTEKKFETGKIVKKPNLRVLRNNVSFHSIPKNMPNSLFQDMLDSFREELGGRTLLEEMNLKKTKVNRTLPAQKKKNMKTNNRTRLLTKRNSSCSVWTPRYTKEKNYESDTSISSIDEIKPNEARSLRSKKITKEHKENANEKIASCAYRRIFESTRFDQRDFLSNENNLENISVKIQRLEALRAYQDYGVAVVSKPAPAWQGMALVNEQFIMMNSKDFLGRYVVLFFYPLDFGSLPYAAQPKEVISFNEKINEFKSINCYVLACSVDSHYTHLEWIRREKEKGIFEEVKIILLSDAKHDISRAYGVYTPESGHTIRALFIIDREGTIQLKLLQNISHEIDVNYVLKQVKSIQRDEKYD